MKKLLLILLIPTITLAQGIKFENLTFNQLLSKAKSENKIIFIDVYSNWLSTDMNKNVFPNDSVGTFYNANFINVLLDMEKEEGEKIVDDYNVTESPTLLYIDGSGKLIHKAVGNHNSKELIDLGKIAINPEKQLYRQIEKFKSGERDAVFLYELVTSALKAGEDDASTYARAYFKTQNNLLTYDIIDLMYQTIDNPESDEFSFLQKNLAKVAIIIDDNSIMPDKLNDVVLTYAIKKINKNEITVNNVASIESIISKYRPNEAKVLSSYYGMVDSDHNGDYVLFEKYALVYLDIKYLDLKSDFLNDTAWKFFENISNKVSLKTALKWALFSVYKSINQYNTDTVANLYHKLGDINNARMYAEISIKLGIKNGDNISATEALLSKLNK